MENSPYRNYPAAGRKSRPPWIFAYVIALAMPAIGLMIVMLTLPGFFEKHSGKEFPQEIVWEQTAPEHDAGAGIPLTIALLLVVIGVGGIYQLTVFFKDDGVMIDAEGVSIPVLPGTDKIPWRDVAGIDLRRQWSTYRWGRKTFERKRNLVGLVLKDRATLMRYTHGWRRPFTWLESHLFGPTVWIQTRHVEAHWKDLYLDLLNAHTKSGAVHPPHAAIMEENKRHTATITIVLLIVCLVFFLLSRFH